MENFKIRNVILDKFSSSDYIKGRNYFEEYIEYNGMEKMSDGLYKYDLDIESENSYNVYKCFFKTDIYGNLKNFYCSCPQFDKTNSCKHLVAALCNYGDEILKEHTEDMDSETITSNIFNSYIINKNIRKIRRELKIETHIMINYNSYYNSFSQELYLKIGEDKLYKCSSYKLKRLLDAIESNSDYEIGKNFHYDSNIHYFSKNDKELIDLLILINSIHYSGNEFYIPHSLFKKLLDIIKDKTFYINENKINKVVYEFPYNTEIIKENNYYIVNIEDEEIFFLSSDLGCIKKNDMVYILNDNQKKFMVLILKNKLKQLKFKEDKLDYFTQNILPNIKDNITISKDVGIVISTKPKVKLYFDLLQDRVSCNIKFIYNDLEIDYFEENKKILRDNEYEDSILDDILTYNFFVENNKIVLNNLDNIVKFIEDTLKKLTEKYEVYTSSKLKEIRVIKKSNVSSTFSIGKDNIMKYSFDLGDIRENEIINIFESLKNKKKYYRLKSGDIIDLEEDKELRKLQELTEDMNLSNRDIQNGEGTIPKYRAIYLDSLKPIMNDIIKTNNLFDELITKFKEYKDSDINLSKKDKELLREYQIDGIKWMYNLYKTGFGGILADEMGLGKSIQTIYLIKEILKEEQNSKFLIVCPTSLAYNWENEFNKFGKEISYKILVGVRNNRREELKNIENTNVLITTYATLREDREYYNNYNFRLMIIDEAQNIKNNNTSITKTVKEISADTKFALTGTPIENSVGELWSIFDFIMPGFLGSIDRFNTKYKIRDFDEDSTQKLEKLNYQVKPFILRRKKKDVIKSLPDKIENNIYVELTREQKKIYLAELEKVNKEMDEILKDEGVNRARFMILKLLTKLRQICIEPSILFANYNGGSGKMEEFVKVVNEVVENGHKVLIFTSFRQALELARNNLIKENITYYVIDGSISSKKRIELVNKFNNDTTNVFFIMLKAGGTGLNLTSADVVIHLDLWWNPQAENQATDRAHRIGQKNIVEVIRFITKGTIEEKILELQNKKKILSDKVIDENNGENSFSKLSEKDIRELLSYENKEE